MKKSIGLLVIVAVAACNIDVKTKDDDSKVDSFVHKADTTLDRWGDSAKEKWKDLKQDVKDKFRKDSSAGKLQ